MCQRVSCRTCQRPTFRGCGNHVEQVLAGVAPADRCHCAEDKAKAKAASKAAKPGGKWWSLRR